MPLSRGKVSILMLNLLGMITIWHKLWPEYGSSDYSDIALFP